MLLGPRRSFFPLALLSLLALLSTASAQVIGIDLGTEYIKAALVKPGIPLDIILTKDSKRKEAAAVAFKPVRSKSSSQNEIYPERAYGGDAVALSARFPGDTFQNIKPLLGLLIGNAEVGAYQERYPGANVVEERDRGMVAIKSETFEEAELPFLVEELLAMELQNIKANGESLAKSKIRDAVITIPAYWTVEEKQAVETAADLAGLKILALTTDGLAVGINYAVTRTFPDVSKGERPEYHLVYDMGAGGTTATVLRFQSRSVKDVGKFNKTVQEVQVTGLGWDRSLGGDALNAIIAKDMVEKLAETDKVKALGASVGDIKGSGRTVSKLIKEAERLRQVLSANTETQASFEGLYHDDVSFKYKLTRAQLEEMAKEYIGLIANPIDLALTQARIKLGDLESIILHGGMTRTPFVQKALEELVGKADKVRNNVNSDESACFGAAFRGAGLSPSFRVKEIRASEIAGHDVWVSWKLDGKDRNQRIFTESSKVGAPKQLPFKTTDDFEFQIYQQVVEGSKMRNIPVWNIKTTNLTGSAKAMAEKHGCAPGEISTNFELWLSPVNGLPDVIRGTLGCEVEDKKSGGIVDGVKGIFGFGKKDEQKPLGGGADDVQSDVGTSTTLASASASSSAAADDLKGKEVEKKVVAEYFGLLQESAGRPQIAHMEMFRLQDRLDGFAKSDKNRKAREEALNVLEGYTYHVRDILEDESFIAVSTTAQRAEIEQKRGAASNWLYDEGSDAKTADFKAKLKELEDLVKPIQQRRDESTQRPEQVEVLEKTLNSTKLLLDALKGMAEEGAKSAAGAASTVTESVASAASSVVDAFADLEDDSSTSSTTSAASMPTPAFTVEDFGPAYETYEKTLAWLKEKVAAQAKLGATDDPALSIADLEAKSKELSKLTTDLMQKQLKMNMPGGGKSSSSTKSKSKSKTKKNKTSKPSPGESTTATVGDKKESSASSAKEEL